ncbi:regulatory protein RecX [Eubacteriales bacterium OttesenSCG-928-K08]|nr:regulatory protein RecX [Eubacteriales bacterium OttesenSCG-928-K08]
MRKFLSKNKVTQAQKGKTPMDAALRYLSSRARSVREVERYLDEQQYGEYEIQQVVDRLTELGYLNDANYADEFVRTRLNTKPISRGHLKTQLLAHELPADIIDEALSKITAEQEFENTLAVAQKHFAQLESYPEKERNERLYRRLLGRGFSHDNIMRAIRCLNEGSNNA